ncbi:M28 family metallopeptidase [Solitalea canadensis]|uniref:Putative aminopeptidase n=1 Tax=Solitalea canadensis (strain ATCC 29591 / DSM 3403 / JCM 21819 / LMG 8368 / NBRC 15130 / NCIMB 12057 / USAM 9D) TaxID=929556 RepID=H8KRK5_SOLCM|nr:M28 family metallopeptidase [Solitalea canadensis]AFD07586.1 putative aminopeptidase [Solitalea canadensis DSM 3403]
MQKSNYYLIAAAVLLFTACQSKKQNNDDGLSAFNADSLAGNIKVLASDEFMGRKPFTEGETKTIEFLEKQFKSLGLEPGNGDSYLQEVPMVNIATKADPIMQISSSKGKFDLKGLNDYVIWTDKTDSVIELKNSEIVFAGYGVVAPEYNWNDYAGLDVKGKVVMVMVNDPGFGSADTTLFKGKTMTYYGRWTYKFEEAGRQGAKGCLIIHNTAAASYPFKVVQNNWNTSRLRLDNRGKSEKLCDMIGWVSADAAKKILAAAGKDSSLLVAANKPDFKPVSLNMQLSAKLKVKATYNKSHNVIAKITGSKHPDECIIYTAHWDHLGIGKADEKGDSIYNGALDNASATAGLLELARGFKSMKEQPERTIVFLSVTAEEQGLWGSAWYAQNPVYPLNKTLANINMDCLNGYGKTNDLVVVGKGQSDLEDYVMEYAKDSGRYIAYESHPEAGHYYRSDHFNFAKVGVPALYVNSGVDVVGKGKEFGKQKSDEYTSQRYHRPSDEFNDTWNLVGAIEDLQLLFKVGKHLAAQEGMPQWKEGSEFKAIREKQ